MRTILMIVGPTAVGKSSLAVTLARRFNGEIISADSRQVYRGLNVGTGKITKKEMRGVPHHLLDVASPKRQFMVAEYQRRAREKIAAIFSRGRLPIICGGTGLYIDATLGRIAIPEVPPNPALRKRLEKKSPEELFEILRKLNAARAQTIDARNPRRLVRAIEIALAHDAHRAPSSSHASPPQRGGSLCSARRCQEPACGGSLTNHAASPAQGSAKGLCSHRVHFWLGLTLPPDELKKKIAARLMRRLKGGLVAEVRALHAHGLSWKRMESLGLEYRYLSRYLRGLLTEKEMIEKLQTEIYRYAKRQMTWFKRNTEIKWLRPSHKTNIFAMLKSTLGD